MRRHILGEVEKLDIAAKVSFIVRFLKSFSLKILLWAMKLSKSSYYEYINRKESQQAENMRFRRQQIAQIFHEFDGIFGARKIRMILSRRGINVSVRTVSNDLKHLGLRSCYVKKYRPRSSYSSDEVCINHLKNIETTRPFEHVATDITYIQTQKDGWVYALTFMDLHTRKVLHFDVSKTMDGDFVNRNTHMLLQRYRQVKLVHSDRGSQYTSRSYRKLLEDAGTIASYSAKGYPYDNAIIESYHGSLKVEKLYRIKILDLKDAYKAVFEYNYGFYNTRRIHYSLGFLTPNEFELSALAS